MTIVVLLLLGFGSVLVVSGLEGVPLMQTFSDIWNDQVTIGQGGQTTGPTTTPHGTGPQNQPVVGQTGQSTITYGGSAGPSAQQDAYRQAVVRAYLQSRR